MATKSYSMGVELTSRNMLTLDELELYELCQLAGVVMEPATFKIILDLLRMNVSPQAVLQMLKSMCASKKKPGPHEGENIPPTRPRHSFKTRNPSSGSSSSRRSESKR